jgi:molecular chaperone DnaK (HSP70)
MVEEAAQKGYKPSISVKSCGGRLVRMPQIMKRIREEFLRPRQNLRPDEAVAKGAAMYANRQAFFNEVLELSARQTGRSVEQVRRKVVRAKPACGSLPIPWSCGGREIPENIAGVDIINVTSRSFGTIAYETRRRRRPREVLYNMILKNTELPALETRRFFTVVDNQRTVSIRVLESLSTERQAAPEEGTEIGETSLSCPRACPRLPRWRSSSALTNRPSGAARESWSGPRRGGPLRDRRRHFPAAWTRQSAAWKKPWCIETGTSAYR